LLYNANIEAVLTTTHVNEIIINRFTADHPLAFDTPTSMSILTAQDHSGAEVLASSKGADSSIASVFLEQALASPPTLFRPRLRL